MLSKIFKSIKPTVIKFWESLPVKIYHDIHTERLGYGIIYIYRHNVFSFPTYIRSKSSESYKIHLSSKYKHIENFIIYYKRTNINRLSLPGTHWSALMFYRNTSDKIYRFIFSSPLDANNYQYSTVYIKPFIAIRIKHNHLHINYTSYLI